MPAASRPAGSTTRSPRRSSAAASMSITAPTKGDPKMKEIAAKLPDAAMTARSWSGASARTSRIARRPSPAPNAMSGASGPSTTPSPIVAAAEREGGDVDAGIAEQAGEAADEARLVLVGHVDHRGAELGVDLDALDRHDAGLAVVEDGAGDGALLRLGDHGERDQGFVVAL